MILFASLIDTNFKYIFIVRLLLATLDSIQKMLGDCKNNLGLKPKWTFLNNFNCGLRSASCSFLADFQDSAKCVMWFITSSLG